MINWEELNWVAQKAESWCCIAISEILQVWGILFIWLNSDQGQNMYPSLGTQILETEYFVEKKTSQAKTGKTCEICWKGQDNVLFGFQGNDIDWLSVPWYYARCEMLTQLRQVFKNKWRFFLLLWAKNLVKVIITLT